MIKTFILVIFIVLNSSILKAENKNPLILENQKFCQLSDLEFSIFKIKIYDISLCNNEKQKLPYQNIYQKDFVISIKYDINISSKKLTKTSIEEIKKHYQISQNEENFIEESLNKIFPNVKKGDIILANYQNKKIYFKHNGREIGQINDENFAKKFLDIWLHSESEYKEMREKLVNY